MTGRTVHVIDDDPDMLKSTAFLLQSLGFESRCFAGPQAFLDAFEGLDPGCVITDLRMPDIDGFDLLRLLRDRSVDWPAVLMTSESRPDLPADAAARGFAGFLRKPFTADALLDVLQTAFAALDTPRG